MSAGKVMELVKKFDTCNESSANRKIDQTSSDPEKQLESWIEHRKRTFEGRRNVESRIRRHSSFKMQSRLSSREFRTCASVDNAKSDLFGEQKDVPPSAANSNSQSTESVKYPELWNGVEEDVQDISEDIYGISQTSSPLEAYNYPIRNPRASEFFNYYITVQFAKEKEKESFESNHKTRTRHHRTIHGCNDDLQQGFDKEILQSLKDFKEFHASMSKIQVSNGEMERVNEDTADVLQKTDDEKLGDVSKNTLMQPLPIVAIDIHLNDMHNYVSTLTIELNSDEKSDQCDAKGEDRSSINSSSTSSFCESQQNLERYSSASTYSIESERGADQLWMASQEYGNVKTETYYDKNSYPRIEKVVDIKVVNGDDDRVDCHSPKKKSKIDYIIQELIETEHNYMNTLTNVITDYMIYLEEIELPASLIGLNPYLFGNIKHIYLKTSEFFNELRQCEGDCMNVVKTFVRNKALFQLYPIYSKNKPKADQYLQNDFKELLQRRQGELNQSLDLASHLLNPIQRLGKYILFLEKMRHELKKQDPEDCPLLEEAISIVRNEMAKGNDFIAIDSIHELPQLNICELGNFVMRDKFLVKSPKKCECVIFLFQKMLIFTTVSPKNSEIFIYKARVPMTDMGIVIIDSKFVFHIRHFLHSKAKKEIKYVIEAKSQKTKEAWTQYIYEQLLQQLQFCKEQQKKLHKQEGRRTSMMSIKPSKRYPIVRGRSIFYDNHGGHFLHT